MAKRVQTRKKAKPRKKTAKALRSGKGGNQTRKLAVRKNKKKKAINNKKAVTAETIRAAEARRKRHLDALGLYEKAMKALQSRNLSAAGNLFETLIVKFPNERELHERSRCHLKVCKREEAPVLTLKTLEEWVYAATLALNAGSNQEALSHLEAAVALEPDSEQVQYMLAVARAATGDETTAIANLERAIELNPDNRFLARQEASFEPMQENEKFQEMLASPSMTETTALQGSTTAVWPEIDN